MAINYEKLLALKIPDAEHTYGNKDTMLYALGLGLGHDPTDRAQLDFVYEKNLKALPTFACLLGYPGFWIRDLDTGIDWVRIVNGEQNPTTAYMTGKLKISGDMGAALKLQKLF